MFIKEELTEEEAKVMVADLLNLPQDEVPDLATVEKWLEVFDRAEMETGTAVLTEAQKRLILSFQKVENRDVHLDPSDVVSLLELFQSQEMDSNVPEKATSEESFVGDHNTLDNARPRSSRILNNIPTRPKLKLRRSDDSDGEGASASDGHPSAASTSTLVCLRLSFLLHMSCRQLNVSFKSTMDHNETREDDIGLYRGSSFSRNLYTNRRLDDSGAFREDRYLRGSPSIRTRSSREKLSKRSIENLVDDDAWTVSNGKQDVWM